MLHLIAKFRPLINKYARKLNYDGADSDLIISFICIIKAIPIKTNPNLKETKQIVGYISNSIRYKYIELSKNHSDRKSTRLNSSHANISYAVFCLKKKNNTLH